MIRWEWGGSKDGGGVGTKGGGVEGGQLSRELMNSDWELGNLE